MSLATKTFYVPTPAADAYRRWKSALNLTGSEPAEGHACSVLDDVPEQEVHWLSRWGFAHIDGKVDFIPAEGGCVVYVSIHGMDVRSRLVLMAASAVARGPWRDVDTFRCSDGPNR